jgi:hypothetical protein
MEVSLSVVKARPRRLPDVHGALHAICSTGKGRCWYCDRRLPRIEQALNSRWDVQRIEGERVATIILVCPKCQGKPKDLEVSERSLVAHM